MRARGDWVRRLAPLLDRSETGAGQYGQPRVAREGGIGGAELAENEDRARTGNRARVGATGAESLGGVRGHSFDCHPSAVTAGGIQAFDTSMP